MLVVIEGSDKAGKSTQTRMLASRLRKKGRRIATLAFPNYSTKTGSEIEAFLHGRRRYPLQVKHMLLSANRWEKKEEIERALKKNNMVILNRYYQSNLVYGCASGLKLKWLEALDAGLPKENLVIVLDVKPTVSMGRMKKKGDLFETNEMMKKACGLYRKLARKYGWVLVDGDRKKEEVHEDIMRIVARKMKQKN